jgi:hypothetical protein
MSSFCLGCGNSLSGEERYCAICGRDSQAAASAPRIDPGVAYGLLPETSGKAIFSLVSGVLFILFPFSFVAVIFGYLALSEIRKSGGRFTGRGLAMTGIVLGYIGVACFLGFIGLGIYEVRKATNARRGIHRNSMTSPTAVTPVNSAVSAMRTLNTAEIAYSQAHHEAGYTCSLRDLSGAWGINADLARGKRNGYVFELRNCGAAKVDGPIVNYRLVAYPSVAAKKGSPAFCSDQSDVIRVARNGSAEDCLQSGIELSASEIQHPQQWPQTSSP